jgi:hypothetical protein
MAHVVIEPLAELAEFLDPSLGRLAQGRNSRLIQT